MCENWSLLWGVPWCDSGHRHFILRCSSLGQDICGVSYFTSSRSWKLVGYHRTLLICGKSLVNGGKSGSLGIRKEIWMPVKTARAPMARDSIGCISFPIVGDRHKISGLPILDWMAWKRCHWEFVSPVIIGLSRGIFCWNRLWINVLPTFVLLIWGHCQKYTNVYHVCFAFILVVFSTREFSVHCLLKRHRILKIPRKISFPLDYFDGYHLKLKSIIFINRPKFITLEKGIWIIGFCAYLLKFLDGAQRLGTLNSNWYMSLFQ